MPKRVKIKGRRDVSGLTYWSIINPDGTYIVRYCPQCLVGKLQQEDGASRDATIFEMFFIKNNYKFLPYCQD